MLLGVNTTCQICPRHCMADRHQRQGLCGAPDQITIASACLHLGEEPPIAGPKGIVNIFFAHCNLHCIYCQNHQISQHTIPHSQETILSAHQLADRIQTLLPLSSGNLGLVTPTHYAHHLPHLIHLLHQRGLHPTIVYNSSGYESVDTLRSLEGLIDIYLPDYKYSQPTLAAAYSHAPDYPQIAQNALLEMQRQVGASLKIDSNGIAYRGMLVRHLVLPGHIDNSIGCLDWLASHLPHSLHLSIMAQYYPPINNLPAPLNRTLTPQEYQLVINHFNSLGLTNGWLQELNSQQHYRPDFSNPNNPFQP